jgi:hypothetical protein
MSTSADLLNGLASAAVLVALLFLFVAGLRLPVARAGWRRWCSQGLVILGALALTLLANIALYHHDMHFDVTHERAFTPSPEAQRVVQGLTTDVDLLYFYQKQHPAGRLAKRLVEIMTRLNPRLHVRTVDLDQYPGLANTYGVRVYNVAVLESSGRRLHVVSTDDRDIALGLLRVTRATVKTICFAVGHGEYDIDNMEYHTHFEGVHTHSHGAEGIGVVLMEQHGLGRLRRALESLGLSTQQVTLATTGRIPEACAVLVEANPHTMYAPSESAVLADYFARGGAVLLMVDLAFPVEPRLAALLAQAGVRVGDGVVVDPLDHYFTDEQMVAVTRYATHAITHGLALSFYPGVRPLAALLAPAITVTPLFLSSAESYVQPLSGRAEKPAAAKVRGPQVLAIASEGVWPGAPHAHAQTFRLVVSGDADFASNSFFPYMSNSDVVLAMLAWLVREEHAPTVKPPIEVLPTVVLTRQQVYGIFAVTVLGLPSLVAALGGVIWWRRRR